VLEIEDGSFNQIKFKRNYNRKDALGKESEVKRMSKLSSVTLHEFN
jgi:hypothetical protein